MYVCACCSRSLAPSLCLSGQRALVGVVVLAFLLFADAQLVVMATPAVDRVRSVIRSLASKTNDLLQDFDGTILYAKLVAEDLEKDHHAPSVLSFPPCSLHTCVNYRESMQLFVFNSHIFVADPCAWSEGKRSKSWRKLRWISSRFRINSAITAKP